MRELNAETPPSGSAGPNPTAAFLLSADARLEPFSDGTAVLYSAKQDRSISLNPSAALLCSFGDGNHTVASVVNELRQLCPDSDITMQHVLDCLSGLAEQGFVSWR